MNEQSHTPGSKAKTLSTADSPPATLFRSQLAATTDFTPHPDLVSLGHHVARVESRPTTIEKMSTRQSERVTTIMASHPAASAPHLAATPVKHGVPFWNSTNAHPLPRKQLKMSRNSAAPAATTSHPATAAAQPPAATSLPTSLSTQAIPSPDSSFREIWNCIKTNNIYFRDAYGQICTKNPCSCVHGLIPPGYYQSAATRTIPKSKTTIAALIPQGPAPAEMELLDLFFDDSNHRRSPQLQTREMSDVPPQSMKAMNRRRRLLTSTKTQSSR